MSFDFTLVHVWMMMMTDPSRQSCGVSTPWTVHTSMAETTSVNENSKMQHLLKSKNAPVKQQRSANSKGRHIVKL